MGLGSAINRLEKSKAKSKVVILLTDGTNNTGDIQPLQAAEIAKSKKIKVYTIGVGTNGTAIQPVFVGGFMQYLIFLLTLKIYQVSVGLPKMTPEDPGAMEHR
jgi:Ca-activated chloride channel family protein